MKARLRFAKQGKVRFTSHRDVVRMWERALRRAMLEVAYTAGFSPRPRFSFGLALSTGHESVAEYLDVELADTEVDIASLPDRLSPALPVGVDVMAAGPVPAGEASLQETVTSCTWRIEALGLGPDTTDELIGRALAAQQLVLTRIRKGRPVTDDLRPAVLSVSSAGAIPNTGAGGPATSGTVIMAELAVHPRSVRPAELLAVLSPEGRLEEGRVLRTAQWIWRDGARDEPLAAPPGALRRQPGVPDAPRRERFNVRPHTSGASDAPPGADPDRAAAEAAHHPVPAIG